MNEVSTQGTALVTGASHGVGACYAEQLAERGFDVILVARNRARMNALASRLTDKTRRNFEVVQADLTDARDLSRVETLLKTDSSITMLVNNAGIAAPRHCDEDACDVSQLIAVNLAALTRLTIAASSAFASRGRGTIIQVAAVKHHQPRGVYDGIAAYTLAYSKSLHAALAEDGIRMQVVLPEPVHRRFKDIMRRDANPRSTSNTRSAHRLVTTALDGLDQGEFVSMASTRLRSHAS